MDLVDSLPDILNYAGSLAQLALVIVFVYVFNKGRGSIENKEASRGIQDAVELLGSNHMSHLDQKLDTLVKESAIHTEILRDIRDSLRK